MGSLSEEVRTEVLCGHICDLEAENAKLQASNEVIAEDHAALCEQNAKLRELARDMWQFTGAACKKYPRLFDHFAPGGQMVKPNMINAFEQRMSDLGIEVSDAGCA